MSVNVSEIPAEAYDSERMEELPFSLVCLDMDGTILNTEHQLSQRTASVINMLSACNVTICIATGRSFPSVVEYVQKSLKLAQKIVPLICFNGSACMLLNTQTGELKQLFCDTIEKEKLTPLVQLCTDRSSGEEKDSVVLQYYGHNGNVYVGSRFTQSELEKDLMRRYTELSGNVQVVTDSYETLIQTGVLPVKCLALTPDVDRLLARASESLPVGAFHMIRGSPFPFFAEFLRPDCTKGNAVEKLVAYLDSQEPQDQSTARRYSLSRTIAFGDGENDIEMLRVVGHGVAMKNGCAAVRSAAKAVSGHTNDEDGVARYLESIFFV